jgi:hypothetical protein
MTTTPETSFTDLPSDHSSSSNQFRNHSEVQPDLEAFLSQAMSYLFPVITETSSTEVETRQFRDIIPRHPSRYRLTFTVARLPAQSLFFDEFLALTSAPPRPRERTLSVALDHHANCPFPTAPRSRTTAHLSTFGTTAPTTSCLVKICAHCMNLHPDIDAQHPNDSYAEFQPVTLEAWLPVRIITRPTYVVLPPPLCDLPHSPECSHTHCQTPLACTCNTPANEEIPISVCSHTHCTDAANCTCTSGCLAPADHVMADSMPHRNCLVAHCDNPAVHLNPNAGSQQPDPRPDPSTLVPPAPRHTMRQIIASFWLDSNFEMFTRSEHAASYATSCANLLPHMRAFLPQVRPVVPLVSDTTLHFPAVVDMNRGLLNPVLYTHTDAIINDSNLIATHSCTFIVCPLTLIINMQTGTRTIGTTSLRQFHAAFRAALLLTTQT